MMCTPWSISCPDDRLTQRPQPFEPPVTSAARGAKKLLVLHVPVAPEGIDHAEMPVERTVILKHQLAATRAELSPTFDPHWFHHPPGPTTPTIVRRYALFVNVTSLRGPETGTTWPRPAVRLRAVLCGHWF